ncbi:divisome protein SepX/GlpR [Kitasatospora fiedleri]|uniref:divisome protein SepX/GlpR n=1 Tax=Kitasatospora fiedleri TaxID=2991545 RepID=UPI00249A820F|nr:gephyrin-like molybdotransferase receptor GlpR [Kitasatospora fiedleri]
MSSSGLIYAVIVGAWAAYLVPMWLRRQDELNESRPTERFSTAIRLLAGRSAMERRAARALGDQTADQQHPAGQDPDGALADPAPASGREPGPAPDPADVPTRAAGPGAGPAAEQVAEPAAEPLATAKPAEGRAEREREREREREHGDRRSAERRALLLARRRRMVTMLFLAFALGAVVAGVAGFAFLWVPAVPGVLLTLYIGHLRRLERQRYEVKFDRGRAAQAAERLRERERERTARPAAAPAADRPAPAAEPAATADPGATRATVLAEATEHEEWADGVRSRAAAGTDSWEPVPVPLPTYVTAPVAPRTTRGLDLSAPNTWDSGRPATPLYDQYGGDPAQPPAAADWATRPRAANE